MKLNTMLCVGLAAVATIIVCYGLTVGIGVFDVHGAGMTLAAAAAMPTARDIVSLRQDRAKAYDRMESVLTTESDTRQADFDAAAAQVEAIDSEIANAEKLQKLRGEKAKGTQESAGFGSDVVQGFMAKYRSLPAAMHDVPEGGILSAAQNAAFGDLLFAVRRAALGRGMDDRLVEVESSSGSNESVPSDGGFLVEKDIADGLLRRTFDVARLTSRARRIPISARSNGAKINALKDDSRATGSRWGGIQMYRIGEGDSLTPSRPKLRQMNLELKKYAGLMYATSEMLADSVLLAGVIQQAYPEELAFMLDDDMFEGPGGAGMLGFMNAGCKVAVAKEAGQATKTVLFENITKMWARLPAGSMSRAEWWVNQDVLPQLMGMSMVIGTGGIPVYLPPGGLSQSPYGTLMSRPVMPIEYCNTLGTEGDIALVDPSQYVMIDKGDIQYATSIHVAFLTDEQAFRFIYRVDGQPVDDKPITPFKGTDKQSTFVTLATR
ncbi:phage major capsid protein [Mesorhizobium sp. M0203]|uniref:phage major capsid protein n=1 Tax=Mesorhizobium sp. M0203 TaxID=2956912 RepID=UPI003335D914